ncbi:probable methyltransferase PMT10 [Humulus lupulus]|uniref:probable methyltransferase PMT10 n=1 Tax=Humulus lupulus TaxID=3486 RepID=UPI002B405126|nr:probable methyltransferase PMT10 [Humulus lupulus]
MKTVTSTATDILKTPTFVKVSAIVLISLSVFFLACHFFSNSYYPLAFTFFSPSSVVSDDDGDFRGFTSSVNSPSLMDSPLSSPLPLPPLRTPPPPPPPSAARRTGIVDENGAMSEEFEVGEFDPSLIEDLRNCSGGGERIDNGVKEKVRVEKFKLCDQSMMDYIPCLDNVEEIKKLNSTQRGEKFERHCPGEGKALDCVVPRPKGYQNRIPWPQSRNEVWFSNVPHTRLVADKGGQNWIAVKEDKFVFPGGGTQFIHGADKYLDQISEMVPQIAFGRNTRIALDIGCGVASFGAFLMQRNVTTLSIAPKDVHKNQIQFALERGVPAMVAAFATRRLLYPSQAFDLIHCSRCRVNWTRDDGILLLEVNRLLRAGGYFVWAAQPVNKHEENLQEQWKEMEDLTTRICWELVKKEGYIVIWQKPLNNSCYSNRNPGVQPQLCDTTDDPDSVWYVSLKPCITRLPDNGFGANLTAWPERLQNPPERLQSITMDGYISRKELLRAESQYWKDIIDGYLRAYHWRELKFRNILDMRAGFGGFATALIEHQYDGWVMNVVPVSGFNTLPVIYDRGLVGVMHDWCEPFDTYPRTYDLIHAAGLFSIEKKRCNITSIMLEIDRMMRPGGRAYIRDSVSVISELQEIASAIGWVPALHDTGEGPFASWKILICEKRL